jgi:hypothetical protein
MLKTGRNNTNNTRHSQPDLHQQENSMTISLAELLKDSAYKLTQFKPKSPLWFNRVSP